MLFVLKTKKYRMSHKHVVRTLNRRGGNIISTLSKRGADQTMRALFGASILAISFLLMMGQRGFAFERGASFTVLPGTTMGLPYAYTGTPGLYFYSLANYGTVSVPREVSPNIGFGPGSIKADVADEIPALLWTTPWTLFGARYAVLVTQPMVSVSSYGQVPGLGWVTRQTGGLRDPIISPLNLSWDLKNGWHIGAGFSMAIPIGRIKGINGLDSAGAPYWTLQPNMGVSYLRDGWDLSATLLYDFYTTNPHSHVTDGQALYLDLTATKMFGRFEIGPVGYVAFQTTRDSGGDPAAFIASRGLVNSCQPIAPNVSNGCVRAAKAGVGAKIGYHIGRAQIAVLATGSVLSHGQGGSDGWRVWTQFSWKLY